jgi:hypothetical protein
MFLWCYEIFDVHFDSAAVIIVSIIKGLTLTMFCGN